MSKFREFIDGIEKDNELFLSMTKAEKRVAIAKDCIARIGLGLFNPNSGSFLYSGTLNKIYDYCEVNNTESLQKVVNQDIECMACAKGGLFLSYVGRVNDFNINKLTYGNDYKNKSHKKLLEIFTLKQIAMIEYAFEGSNYSEVGFSDKIDKLLLSYRDRFEEKERMIEICNNIIRNNGTFNPNL